MTDTPRPAVTFDLWHTLIYLSPEDEEAYMNGQSAIAVESLKEAAIAPGVPVAPVAELAERFGREYRAAVAAAESGRAVSPAEQYRLAAHSSGRDPDPSRYLARLGDLAGGLPFRRAPGALEALRDLRGSGFDVAVISNTVGEPGACLRPALRRLGFEESVEEFVFSDEHPWAKPSPEIFRFALDLLGARASESIHVGDGWADIEGARRAGYRAGIRYVGLPNYGTQYAVLFAPPVGRPMPRGWEIDRLDDVPALVERIRRGEAPPAP
jgi:FMN phosphatase YigB (HAD superfamily)